MVTMSGLGVAPSRPPAIMCSGMKAAPADVPATCMPSALRRRSACAIDVPPIVVGHKDAVALLDVTEVLVGLAVLARDEVQHADVLATELAEQFFVVSSGVFEFGCGGNDADTRILTAADVDKPAEDFRIIEFFLGATDRNDVTAISAVGFR